MGKKSSKQKTETTPWQPLQQPIINAVNTASGIVNDNQGHLDQIAGDIRGYLPQLGHQAFGQQPGVAAGLSYANDVLGGKYLGQGNPYLNGMIGQARENTANDVQSRFGLAGRTGSGANIGALTKGLDNAELGLRYQDYSSERDRMAQQQGMLPSLVSAQYAGIAPYLATAQAGAQAPYEGVSALSPIIGLAQGSGTSTTTQKQPWGAGLLGAVSGGLSSLGALGLLGKSGGSIANGVW